MEKHEIGQLVLILLLLWAWIRVDHYRSIAATVCAEGGR